MEQVETLSDALPHEMARVRVLLGHYKAIGPGGELGAVLIEMDLGAADRAIRDGDVVAMLVALVILRSIKS